MDGHEDYYGRDARPPRGPAAGPSIIFEDANERQGGFLRRGFVLGAGVTAGLGVLAARLADLQLVETGRFQGLAFANQWKFRLVPPRRGRIVDRNGVVLADSRPSFRLLVVRDETSDLGRTLDDVARLVPATAGRRRRLISEINQSPRGAPVAVATDLSWDEFARINLQVRDLPGVESDMNEVRYYPNPGAFAHVIGYVAKATKADVDQAQAASPAHAVDPVLRHPGFRIGKQGIEKALDLDLRGKPGGRKIEVDARGRVVAEDPDGDRAPVSGAEVALTLDADIQNRALEVFGSDSGACVVMDVKSGDVLCLLSAPGFDANAFVSGAPAPLYLALMAYDHKPLLNKALSGTYPAGSTFKTMVALAALEMGISPGTTYVCNRAWTFGGHTFHCDERHGPLDMRGAIAHSCDVYFYETALKVGPDRIAATARKFGLNDVFDIGVPGQHRGILPDTAWKRAYYRDPRLQKWTPGDTPSYGIGQGYLAINPLQLCVMCARLANGGRAVVPRLIRSIGGQAQPAGAEAAAIEVDASHLAFVRGAMAAVVETGTGSSARLGLGDVEMAGKTGTAQVRTIRTGQSRDTTHAPWEGREHAWFIAFAPSDAPRYALSVLVEHGGFARSSSAPKAREIMRTTLLKDPDIRRRLQGAGAEGCTETAGA
jgi:penicillin-binding protein 2